MIAIDIPKYSIELMVSEKELEDRKKTMKIKPPYSGSGYIARYARNVSSAEKGAVVT